MGKEMISLNDKLDLKQLEISNAAGSDTAFLRALIDPSSKSVIKSDTDEQLMIYLPFQESVKAHSIILRTNPESLDKAPSKLQIFINRPNILSFDDVGSLTATQEISSNEINYNDQGEANIPLRFVKFQKTTSLVIFVEENQGGDDETVLRSLEILGEVGTANSSGVVTKIDHDHD